MLNRGGGIFCHLIKINLLCIQLAYILYMSRCTLIFNVLSIILLHDKYITTNKQNYYYEQKVILRHVRSNNNGAVNIVFE